MNTRIQNDWQTNRQTTAETTPALHSISTCRQTSVLPVDVMCVLQLGNITQMLTRATVSAAPLPTSSHVSIIPNISYFTNPSATLQQFNSQLGHVSHVKLGPLHQHCLVQMYIHKHVRKTWSLTKSKINNGGGEQKYSLPHPANSNLNKITLGWLLGLSLALSLASNTVASSRYKTATMGSVLSEVILSANIHC